MEIWEEKYESAEHGMEPDASFKYFNRMLSEPYRNYSAVAKKIALEEIQAEQEDFLATNPNKEYIPPTEDEIKKRAKQVYQTLNYYSSKWNWKERMNAYDLYISIKHREQKEMMVLDWEKEQLKIALSRPFIHHKTLQEIHNASEEEMPISKRAYAEETNERAYYNSLQAVYSILHSGVQVVESSETQMTNIRKEEKIISNTIYDAVDKVLGLQSNENKTTETKTIKKEPRKVIKNGD